MRWLKRSKGRIDTAEVPEESLPKRSKRWALGAKSRRLFLQVGLPWAAALLVGLVSVLYADWSRRASEAFLGWIAGRSWLAFIITPALTVLALFLTRRWFTGSEGSGIPQVITALHARRAQEEDTLMRRLFGLRVVVGKIGISLLGLLGGLTIGREGPTVHIGAATMAEFRRFYPHPHPQLERRLLLAGAAAGLSAAFNTPLAGIMSIGAGLAQWVHVAFPWAPMGAVIAVCMTGYLAAVTQSPITSFVIVLEMTNGGSMVIPMMAAALVAARISAFFTPPLYEALAKNNYFHIATLPVGSFLQKKPVPPPGA